MDRRSVITFSMRCSSSLVFIDGILRYPSTYHLAAGRSRCRGRLRQPRFGPPGSAPILVRDKANTDEHARALRIEGWRSRSHRTSTHEDDVIRTPIAKRLHGGTAR